MDKGDIPRAPALSQRPPALRVTWISGHRPERLKRGSASIVAVVTGCIAPGLKQPIKTIILLWLPETRAHFKNKLSKLRKKTPAAARAVAPKFPIRISIFVSIHQEMVDFGSGLGRSEFETDGVAVSAKAGVAALRRGFQRSENNGLDQGPRRSCGSALRCHL
jgi:hypothetical protein